MDSLEMSSIHVSVPVQKASGEATRIQQTEQPHECVTRHHIRERSEAEGESDVRWSTQQR